MSFLFNSKTYEKIYHISNSITNEKICDIHLIASHNLSVSSTIAAYCEINDSIATMEGAKTKNCFNQEIKTIKNNIPITIKHKSISEIFDTHSFQFVLDTAPIWNNPYSQLHLYINNKNVMNPTRSVKEYTQVSYTTTKVCVRWSLMLTMAMVFTLIYGLVFSLSKISTYKWIAIESIAFGFFTWMALWTLVNKSLGYCTDSGPMEIDISFDPNTGTVSEKQSNECIKTETESEPLPYGWKKVCSDGQRVYWQNHITKQIQWDKPIDVIAQQEWVSPMDLIMNEAVEIVQVSVDDIDKEMIELCTDETRGE